MYGHVCLNSAQSEREALILSAVQMVKAVAQRTRGKLPPWLDFEEIVAAGNLGLVEAAHRYDPARGKFSAFAWRYIQGHIYNAFTGPAFRDECAAHLESVREELGAIPARMDTDPSPLPDQGIAQRETQRLLAGVIRGLPRQERAVLTAVIGGAPLPAVALGLGCAVEVAAAHLRAARRAVAAAIGNRASSPFFADSEAEWYHCRSCGRYFDRAWRGRVGKRYCSKACSLRTKVSDTEVSGGWRWRCLICGAEFSELPKNGAGRKYCGRRCALASRYRTALNGGELICIQSPAEVK